MQEKIVCFAGHRYQWYNVGIEGKLRAVIEDLINRGYNIFYDGDRGYFDKLSAKIVLEMKKKYSHIKLIKVLTYYNYDKNKFQLPDCYDGSVYFDIENCHPKQIIIKRNQWLIDRCNALVCHIKEKYKIGAYRTYKYAQKLHKYIIEI